jgi:hypothetical protein
MTIESRLQMGLYRGLDIVRAHWLGKKAVHPCKQAVKML